MCTICRCHEAAATPNATPMPIRQSRGRFRQAAAACPSCATGCSQHNTPSNLPPLFSESAQLPGKQVFFPIRVFSYLLICAACNDFAGYAMFNQPKVGFFTNPASAFLQPVKVE